MCGSSSVSNLLWMGSLHYPVVGFWPSASQLLGGPCTGAWLPCGILQKTLFFDIAKKVTFSKKKRFIYSVVKAIHWCSWIWNPSKCLVTPERKSKDRPTGTPNVVFVVASHYQSLQIIVLLLQGCRLEIYLFCKI